VGITTREPPGNESSGEDSMILSVALQLSHPWERESRSLNVKLWHRGFGISFDARLARFRTLC
jgi:hypothetical protein